MSQADRAFVPTAPDARAAVLFLLANLAISTLMIWLIKTLGASFGPFQIMLARAATMAVLLAPFALLRPGGAAAPVGASPMKMAVRSLLGFGGQAFGIAALIALPLTQAQTLGFTKGVLAVGLAALLLGERVGPRRWIALGVGFAGVVVAMRPQAGFEPAALLGLASAACFAASTVVVKQLTREADDLSLMFWGSLGQAGLSLGPALLFWTPPAASDAPFLLSLGLVGIALQATMLGAYRRGEVSALAPLDYLRLPIGVALGFFAFGETPGPAVFAGAALIVAANWIGAGRTRPPR